MAMARYIGAMNQFRHRGVMGKIFRAFPRTGICPNLLSVFHFLVGLLGLKSSYGSSNSSSSFVSYTYLLYFSFLPNPSWSHSLIPCADPAR